VGCTHTPSLKDGTTSFVIFVISLFECNHAVDREEIQDPLPPAELLYGQAY
jgi:hypothetical protein